jgi:hypothetical protein
VSFISATDARRALSSSVFAILTVLTVVFASFAPSASGVSAKAPPHATTLVVVSAYSAPDVNAEVVTIFPAGAELELTGDAAPGFLGVLYDGREVFVPGQFLTLGFRPGIDTAVTLEDAPLLEAPLRDANVRLTIPEGQTVILTGATVDGYDAASYDGAGGWIDRRGLAR